MSRLAVARRPGERAQPLLDVEQLLAALLHEDDAEQVAEQPNVAAERRVGIPVRGRHRSARSVCVISSGAIVPSSSAATSPTTSSAGVGKPGGGGGEVLERRPAHDLLVGHVPREITAAGVAGASPAARRPRDDALDPVERP